MVKIGKLWGDAVFEVLPPEEKLMYIYLCTQPGISTLGVVNLTEDRFQRAMQCIHDPALKQMAGVLELKGYIYRLYRPDYISFIVKDHFKSLAKSKANFRKAKDEWESSDSELHSVLGQMFSDDDFTNDEFVPPDPEEVTKYALDKGYDVNGKTFCDHYGDNDWYNKNGKIVKNWKKTLLRVWCRENNKLVRVKGAPKGYEYFFAVAENGDKVFPEAWKEGRPTHSDFLYSELLNDQFDFYESCK